MTTVGNPFSDSDFVWTPSTAAGTKSQASLVKFLGTGADDETAVTLELADVSATDFVVTVQCVGTGDEYFRRDLRGAWFRDDATVNEVDAPSTNGDASANDGDFDAYLELDGTDVLIKVSGDADAKWSFSINCLVTARDAFDPLSYGTPILWLDSTDMPNAGGFLTGATNKASSGISVNLVGGKEPAYATNAEYEGASTINCGSNQGLTLTSHGITTGGFTLVVVGDGVDGVWLQDANGNYLANAGGGSGNDLQMTSNGATAINTGSGARGNESGVPGVYAFVFAGSSSKIFSSAETVAVGPANAGSLSSLSATTIAIGGTYNLSGAGLGGSFRHVLMYAGALPDADIVELLNGFAPCVTGLTIGA